MTVDNGETVLPDQPADLENIQHNLGNISRKLDKIPFDEIGANLNHVLEGADHIVNGADLKHSLARSFRDACAGEGIWCARRIRGRRRRLQRLPKISQDLQDTVERASKLCGEFEPGRGRQFGIRGAASTGC